MFFASVFLTTAAAKAGVNDQIALLEKTKSSLLQYPTDFTQGIVPKAIHSHNDCALLATYHVYQTLMLTWFLF